MEYRMVSSCHAAAAAATTTLACHYLEADRGNTERWTGERAHGGGERGPVSLSLSVCLPRLTPIADGYARINTSLNDSIMNRGRGRLGRTGRDGAR